MGARVLVVEDERDIAFPLVRTLEREGYEVSWVGTGSDGLDAIAQRRVPGDVIDVELERHEGAWRYEIKVLTSTGRVREIKLNARTGAILEIEDD